MAIRVLDVHTAELIAAGEVVERPASVVKELVENAIDAGAATITVEIERGGIALIRVADNGGGIAADEIPLAFLRHATSKVRTKEDLEAISTLGFRGEALASIASVAQVELLTQTPQDEFASLYRIAGGREEGLAPSARPLGTTITVQNLFYNTPARMKFLKKDASEGTFVTETVTRLSLSHPEISFRYLRDGKLVFSTPGDGKLSSAAYAVLGAQFARGLLPAEGGNARYRVQGLITSPHHARASRAMQFFFINGRFVKNRTMMAALEQAYRGMAMSGKFPGCVLFLAMPPELVDVNVHPAKTEVRFAREGDVFDAVYQTVKSALLADGAAHRWLELAGTPPPSAPAQPQPEGESRGEPGPVAAGERQGALASSFRAAEQQPAPPRAGKPAAVRAYNAMLDTLASDDNFTPYYTAGPAPRSRAGEAGLSIEPGGPERPAGEPEHRDLDACSRPEHMAGNDAAVQETGEAALPAPDAPGVQTSFAEPAAGPPALRVVGEAFKTYIVAQWNDSLCLIDKHAAHERLLYEQLAAQRQGAGVQQLLAPVTVALSAAEKNALLQNQAALHNAGLEVDDFGGNEVLVRGVPADVEPGSVPDLVIEVAGRMALNSRDTLNEKTEWVLHSMACRAAVKAGDATRPEQLVRLAEDILCGRVPPFCPHGRPVVLEITRKELEKQFGRLG